MAKKQIRDKDGKFSTKVGDGGLKSQKEVNLKRVLPIVILVAFVGGWLVSQSFAAPRTGSRSTSRSASQNTPKPGSFEEKQQELFKAPQVGDVLKPPVSEESRIKDEQSGAFNEHYAPIEQFETSINRGRLPTVEYAKCIQATSSFVKGFATNKRTADLITSASYVLRTKGVASKPTIQDAKDCGIPVSVAYRCTYYQKKLVALNGKYSKEYFNKNRPSEADLSSGKISMKDMIPKDKVMDYYRTEGALMSCNGNDFSKNNKDTTYSTPYRP